MLFCWSLSNIIQTINPKPTELNVNSDHQLSTFPTLHHVCFEKGKWSQCLLGTSLLQIQDPSFVYCLSRNQNAYILKSLDFDLPTFQTKQSHRHEFIPTKKWYPMKASKSIRNKKDIAKTHTHTQAINNIPPIIRKQINKNTKFYHFPNLHQGQDGWTNRSLTSTPLLPGTPQTRSDEMSTSDLETLNALFQTNMTIENDSLQSYLSSQHDTQEGWSLRSASTHQGVHQWLNTTDEEHT